jgi:hypothetical protein
LTQITAPGVIGPSHEGQLASDAGACGLAFASTRAVSNSSSSQELMPGSAVAGSTGFALATGAAAARTAVDFAAARFADAEGAAARMAADFVAGTAPATDFALAAGIFILWPHWPHFALLPASSSLTL